MKRVIEAQKHPPFALISLKNAYVTGGEDGLRSACEAMPEDQISGIVTWLGEIGSEFTVMGSTVRMAYLAAKQLCDRGEVYSIFDHDGRDADAPEAQS